MYEWIDKLTAEEVAEVHGISRRHVFRWQQSGLLTKLDWSRSVNSLRHPFSPGSYMHLLEWVIERAVQLYGRELVAGFIETMRCLRPPKPITPPRAFSKPPLAPTAAQSKPKE